jgi:hypothetical protein
MNDRVDYYINNTKNYNNCDQTKKILWTTFTITPIQSETQSVLLSLTPTLTSKEYGTICGLLHVSSVPQIALIEHS